MSSKKFGRCPKCGANYKSYKYPKGSRFKHCFACGYDTQDWRAAALKKYRKLNP